MGTVTISSTSVFDKPVIDLNYLSDPNDLQILLRAQRLCMRIAHAKALQSMLDLKPNPTNKNDPFWTGDVDPDKVTDEELIELIKNGAQTLYHPVGTARMGISEKNSVVDPDLKVHGVQGLRVVDASIFPTITSGALVSVVFAEPAMFLNLFLRLQRLLRSPKRLRR